MSEEHSAEVTVPTPDDRKLKPSKSAKAEAPPAPTPTPVDPVSSEKLKDRAMVTTITLPSMGIPYGDKLPGGQILISSLTIADEKTFAARGTGQADKTNMLITRACDIGSLAPDELLASDRFYILMKVRAVSYGSDYGFQFRCDECSVQGRYTINLETDLNLRTLSDAWIEPFSVHLPMSNKTLECRLLRGKDERQIAAMVKRKQQKNIAEEGSATYPMLLARHIVSVDGEAPSEVTAIQFIERLPVGDRRAITDAVEVNSPGYDPEIEIECRNCGYLSEVALPVSAEFFQPKHHSA